MSYSIEALLEDMQTEFSLEFVRFEEVKYGGVIPAFFISIDTEENLTNRWMDIARFIAVNFQSRLMNEYNMEYLRLFLVKK